MCGHIAKMPILPAREGLREIIDGSILPLYFVVWSGDDIPCGASDRQVVYMECQIPFSSISKKMKRLRVLSSAVGVEAYKDNTITVVQTSV